MGYDVKRLTGVSSITRLLPVDNRRRTFRLFSIFASPLQFLYFGTPSSGQVFAVSSGSANEFLYCDYGDLITREIYYDPQGSNRTLTYLTTWDDDDGEMRARIAKIPSCRRDYRFYYTGDMFFDEFKLCDSNPVRTKLIINFQLTTTQTAFKLTQTQEPFPPTQYVSLQGNSIDSRFFAEDYGDFVFTSLFAQPVGGGFVSNLTFNEEFALL